MKRATGRGWPPSPGCAALRRAGVRPRAPAGPRVHAGHGALAALRRLRPQPGHARRQDAAAAGGRHGPARLPAASTTGRAAGRRRRAPGASCTIPLAVTPRALARGQRALRDLLPRLPRRSTARATARSCPAIPNAARRTRPRACAAFPPGQLFHVITLGSGTHALATRRRCSPERPLAASCVTCSAWQARELRSARRHEAARATFAPSAPVAAGRRSALFALAVAGRGAPASCGSPAAHLAEPAARRASTSCASALAGALFLSIQHLSGAGWSRGPAPRARGDDGRAARWPPCWCCRCSSAGTPSTRSAAARRHGAARPGQGRLPAARRSWPVRDGGRARALGAARAGAPARVAAPGRGRAARPTTTALVQALGGLRRRLRAHLLAGQRRLADVARPALVQHDVRGLRLRGPVRAGHRRRSRSSC